ncbi:hypothetical protein BST97_07660 [Nonlabens spongiae]|uniref:Outer membrane protein beta-barrel domain-containing protein n=1 Tax=Nonlabens spongiae TaxID=331648 RepID=A0A1W6MJV4_9FLAO|nr:hypothetical protein [Nonlabens spongiae]ARN77888.1 hypothetical protein BST97_07660 [Nonlabens spongiae]
MTKFYSTLLVVLFFNLKVHSQNTPGSIASVEQSIYGVQTGFLGAWVHNESRLSNSIALRSEVGLDATFGYNSFLGDYFKMVPVLTLEPRWYYNLERRLRKSKRIDNNAGNFIALKTSLRPDLFEIGSNDNIRIIPDFQLIPTYGLRRNIGQHFNYEVGFGIGYIRYFEERLRDQNDAVVNLHLRIGYRF